MNRQEIDARYVQLRADLDAGRITPEAFQGEAAQFSYQASDGIWYHIDPATGGWLRWDGRQWQPLGGTAASIPTSPVAAASAPQTAILGSPADTAQESKPLPTKFLPLLGVILKLTLKSFLKSLPITLLLMAGSVALYFYILVVKNGGLGTGANGFLERLLGVGAQGYTRFTPGLSGAVVFGVGSTLLYGFVVNLFRKGPGRAVADLVAMPREIQTHFRESGTFAAASLASGAGVALVVGSLVGGYANLAMALGAGAMLASRAAPMVSLLFRSLWSSTFGVLQGGRAPQCPLGAGHVAMLGGSIGFILRAILPKALSNMNATVGAAPVTNLFGDPAFLIGLGLLVAAGVLAARSSHRSGPVSTAAILILAMVLAVAPAAIVRADNGGWIEGKGDSDNLLVQFWHWLFVSPNAWVALWNTLIPALGLAIGPAFWSAMIQAMSRAGAQAVGVTAAGPPPLIDPDTGKPLVIHDGRSYQGGQAGQVWYDGQWVDRDTAAQWVRERQDQLRRRQGEIDQFQRDTDAQRQARSEQRDRDLQNQGYRWDAGQQAWVRDTSRPPPMTPDEARRNEYYNRGDWIKDNLSRLSPEQQVAAQRILDRMGYRSTGADPGGISDDDLSNLRRLTGAMNNLNTGRSETAGADADRDGANAEFAVQVAQSTAQVGRMAAAVVERRFIPGTNGAISGFIFGAAGNWDKGWGGAIKHGAISAGTTYADGRIGGSKPGNILWNAGSGALTSAADVALQGGSTDEMRDAALVGGAFGGASAALSRPGVQGALDRMNQRFFGGSRGPQLPTIHGGDPSLQVGSRGFGSNDLDGGAVPWSRPATPDPNIPRIQAGDDPSLSVGSRTTGSSQAPPPSVSGEGLDPATGRQTLAPAVEGSDHKQGGASVEEDNRVFREENFLITRDGQVIPVTGTGMADRPVGPGEIIVSRGRPGPDGRPGAVTVQQRDETIPRERAQAVAAQANLPPPQGFRQAAPIPGADSDRRIDMSASASLPGGAGEPEADALLRQIGGHGGARLSPSPGHPAAAEGGAGDPPGPGPGSGASDAEPPRGPGGTLIRQAAPQEHDAAVTPQSSRPQAPLETPAANGSSTGSSSPVGGPGEPQSFPRTGAEWSTYDREHGIGPRGDELPPTGIDRTQYVKDLIKQRPDLQLDSLDTKVREAWRQAGGGLDPNSWKVFEQQLTIQGVSQDELARWNDLVVDRNLPPAPPGSTTTTRPGS